VEDGEERQLPGNVRAADRWSVRSVGLPEAAEGCALLGCQQAVADCRVNRAHPTDAPAASVARRGSGAISLFLLKNSTFSQYLRQISGCRMDRYRSAMA